MMFRFLRGLEELRVPKEVKAELGGGKKEFSLAEGLTVLISLQHNYHRMFSLGRRQLC